MKFLSLMIPKEAVESGWLDITSAEERTNRTLTQRIDGNHRILKWMLAHSRPQSIRTTMNYLFEGRAISGIFELGDSALPSSVWSNWQGGILCFPMDEVTACMMNLLYDWIIICTSFVQCWVMCGLLCESIVCERSSSCGLFPAIISPLFFVWAQCCIIKIRWGLLMLGFLSELFRLHRQPTGLKTVGSVAGTPNSSQQPIINPPSSTMI